MNEQLKTRIEALNKTGANLALKQIEDKYSLEANGFRIAPLGTENEIEMFLRGYAKAQEAIFKPVLPKIIRRLRILEYVGSQEWIDTMIANRHVKGTQVVKDGSIREAMLGDTNEVMLEAEIEQLVAERKQALDSQLLQQELPNSNINIELTASGNPGSGQDNILTFIADALRQKDCVIMNTGQHSIRVTKSKDDNS